MSLFDQMMQIGKEWGFPAMLLVGIGMTVILFLRQNATHQRKIDEERQKHDQKREDENAAREALREERMGKRLDEQQEMIQGTLMAQLEKSNSAIARMSQTCEEVSRTHREIVESNKLVVEHCLGARK